MDEAAEFHQQPAGPFTEGLDWLCQPTGTTVATRAISAWARAISARSGASSMPACCGSGGDTVPNVAAADSFFFDCYQTPAPATDLYLGLFVSPLA